MRIHKENSLTEFGDFSVALQTKKSLHPLYISPRHRKDTALQVQRVVVRVGIYVHSLKIRAMMRNKGRGIGKRFALGGHK